MEKDTPKTPSDTTSCSEYLDAEDESGNETEFGKENVSAISEIRESLKAETSTSEGAVGEQLVEENDMKTCPLKPVNDDIVQDRIWKTHKKHIFVLSEAGKPIYSLHGAEDDLAALFGVIQALVSFVQLTQDAIVSIHAAGLKFAFLSRNSLILVAASRSAFLSIPQIQMQLSDVYNQIISILTYSHMNKIFEKRKNFDLRRLLAGSERLIHNLVTNDSSHGKISDNIFMSLTNSIRVLPLSLSHRTSITNAIQSSCSKVKNLVFAVLIASNKLIALVRMKKYTINPADLRLIFNLVECSESFKTSENWTPICLPKFDMNGFLHAHVSYLSEDCQACLLLFSVDRDDFFVLSDAKKRIIEKLKRSNSLQTIADEINKPLDRLNLQNIGVLDLRHFLYKPRSLSQILCGEILFPYTALSEFEHLEGIYSDLIHRMHNTNRPVKLIYEAREREIVLGWATTAYDLYAVFEPLVDKNHVIKYVDKLIKFIEKEHDVFFIRTHPTF